jgi:hypothetical protein
VVDQCSSSSSMFLFHVDQWTKSIQSLLSSLSFVIYRAGNVTL